MYNSVADLCLLSFFLSCFTFHASRFTVSRLLSFPFILSIHLLFRPSPRAVLLYYVVSVSFFVRPTVSVSVRVRGGRKRAEAVPFFGIFPLVFCVCADLGRILFFE
jgi:hypothetical protein